MEQLNDAVSWIRSNHPRRIAVLTGAGISAESGVPTFRGSGGLWKNFRAEDLATPEAFARDAALVWEWYEWRRSLVRDCAPNAAHTALARLAQHDELEVSVITQNVDGLHTRAGSIGTIELHGNLFRVRCTREETTQEATAPFPSLPPLCACGALLRPDIVWFGEALEPEDINRAVELISHADLLLIIGTSGLVYPAAGLMSSLQRGISMEINPDSTPLSTSCDFVIEETASRAVPVIVDAILEVAQ